LYVTPGSAAVNDAWPPCKRDAGIEVVARGEEMRIAIPQSIA